MKYIHSACLFFGLCLVLIGFQSCSDESCTTTVTYFDFEAVWVSEDSIHSELIIRDPQPLQQPGKIYVYQSYLLINDRQKGVHIFDNSDPSDPVALSFIEITGNQDVAVQNNILYADSYYDLIAIDISDVANIHEAGRLPFFREPRRFDEARRAYIVEYLPVEKTAEVDCDNPFGLGRPDILIDESILATDQAVFESSGAPTTTGTGGSMARFTIAQNHLYIANDASIQVIALTDPTALALSNEVFMPWGIETIFPYGDKLFVGANDGMHILDAQEPSHPEHVSTFQHARACDPVFIHNNVAFVTLRDGNECQTFTNQLDVVDVKDIFHPTLIKSYDMEHPHGLSVRNDHLFLCEGQHGLKIFGTTDLLSIADRQKVHLSGFDAFDVIAMASNVLLIIGSDGLYQYDVRNTEQPQLLSFIPVEK